MIRAFRQIQRSFQATRYQFSQPAKEDEEEVAEEEVAATEVLDPEDEEFQSMNKDQRLALIRKVDIKRREAAELILPPRDPESFEEYHKGYFDDLRINNPINLFTNFAKQNSNKELIEDWIELYQDWQEDQCPIEESGIIEFIKSCVESQHYQFMKPEEFFQIIVHPYVLRNLHIFNQEFFKQNDLIGQQQISEYIQLSLKKIHEPLKLLRYINSKPDNYFDEYSFETFVSQVPDPLSCYYFFYHENKTNIVNVDTFAPYLLNITWSNSNQELVSNTIKNLLLHKFKLNMHKPLRIYLADVFFGEKNYEFAILATVLQILVLERIALNKPVSDLLEIYKSTFGDEKYKFYFETQLPLILKEYVLQVNYHSYTQSLLEHQKQASGRSSYGTLDGLFYRSKAIYVADQQIPYQNDQQNLFNFHQVDEALFQNMRLQKAIVENDEVYLHSQLFKIVGSHDDILIKADQILGKYEIHTENDEFGRLDLRDAEDDPESFQQDDKQQFRQNDRQNGNRQFNQNNSNQKKTFTRKMTQQPISEFCTEEGFLSYLKKAKAIDLEVKKTEHKKPEQVITHDEVQSYKTIFMRDKDNIRKQKEEPQLKRQNQFRKLGEKPIIVEHVVAPEVKEVPKVITEYDEVPLVDHDLKSRAINRVKQLTNHALEPKEQFESARQVCLQQNDLYFVDEFIREFNNVFTGIFNHKEGVEVKQDLEFTYVTQFGEIRKNYGPYLEKTSLPYNLGPAGYNYLLRDQLTNFKRLQYKRTITHLAVYSDILYDSTLDLILQIAVANKIPQTLSELLYLMVHRKVQITEKQLTKIISSLIKFKKYEAELENFIAHYYTQYNKPLQYVDIEEFVVKCIKRGLKDRYMSLYEQLKDLILARKPAEGVSLNEFKVQQREQIAEFVRNVVKELISKNLILDAKLLMNDAKGIRYKFTEIDYAYWIRSHAETYDDAMKIYKDFLKKYTTITPPVFESLLKVFQFTPAPGKQLFQELIKAQIFTGTIPLNDDLIVSLAQTLRRLREFSIFQSFLKYLMEINYKVNQTHKTVFYKIMNSAEDDSQKSQIRGIIDKLYEEQEMKKTAVKVQQIVVKTETVEGEAEEEEGPAPKLLSRNRKRGGHVKYGLIEGDKLVAKSAEPEAGKKRKY